MKKAEYLKIGTRGSPLAVRQAEWIKGRLEELFPQIIIELKKISTKGDRILDSPLAQIGGKGLFVKEIEEELLQRKIDLAVHSMKDLPAEIPTGLTIAAVCKREDPRDVIICKKAKGFNDLPKKARIGTASLRRASQILHLRPEVELLPIRGNIGTRLRKMDTENLDAIILAAAGLIRMEMEEIITEYFSISKMLPAAGQGALGVESRIDNPINELLKKLHHEPTGLAITAERSFLARLEGGCQVPMGVHAIIEGKNLLLDGFIASLDGRILLRETISGTAQEGHDIGIALAEKLLESGGDNILKSTFKYFHQASE